MTVRLVTGPPGAGKNYYVDQNKKPEDYVLDFDDLRDLFPTLATAKDIRDTLEAKLKDHEGDAWVIRCAADPKKRAQVAERCGADEVIVIETPAEVAKQRIAERDKDNPELVQKLSDSVDQWWSQYAMVQSDLIIKPDTGNLSDREKNVPQDHKNKDDNNAGGDGADKGFPAETPVADMTAEQQAAYWKFHSRKHETLAKSREDYDDLKAAAEKWRDHEKAQKPADQVKAEEKAEEIRQAAEKAANAKVAAKLVTAEFKVATAGRMKLEDLELVLEDLDLTKYLTEDGDVDTDRVAKRAAILAPETATRPGTRRTHQTRRPNDKGSSVQSGRDLYEETHGKKK